MPERLETNGSVPVCSGNASEEMREMYREAVRGNVIEAVLSYFLNDLLLLCEERDG